MGIATKYVKDKGSTPEIGAMCGSLLPIEEKFYLQDRATVLFSGDTGNLPLELRAQIESMLLRNAKTERADWPELSDKFRYAYTNEAFVGDAVSFVIDHNRALSSRRIAACRVAVRTCTESAGTAFLLFHYSIEFLSGEYSWREDGECAQTWIHVDSLWTLLGEYIDGVYVEATGKLNG